MDASLIGALFGLSAACFWGVGDFGGGLAVRRTHAFLVVALSDSAGLLLLSVFALILREPLPPATDLLWAAAAGVAGGSGLVALYQGLAIGRMGLVAPVSAVVSAGVPVLFGVFLEGLPAPLQMLGFGLALLAVWIVSQSGGLGREGFGRRDARELGLAVLSGCGFGIWLILIDRVSSQGIVWPLIVSKSTYLCLLLVILAVRRPQTGLSRRQLPLILATGLADTGGSTCYALAAQMGRLDVAAVLSSLHPAVTVLAARLLLAEPVSRRRWLGIGAALVAVLLIAG